MPKGWILFGLVSLKASANDATNEWNRAYHGTKRSALPGILRTGQLCPPGMRVVAGHTIGIRDGHIKRTFTRQNLATGGEEEFDPNQVFMSPSIKYSSDEIYAPGFE